MKSPEKFLKVYTGSKIEHSFNKGEFIEMFSKKDVIFFLNMYRYDALQEQINLLELLLLASEDDFDLGGGKYILRNEIESLKLEKEQFYNENLIVK